MDTVQPDQIPPQPPVAPPVAPVSAPMSEDHKTLITVLVLVFAYPIGVILMWVWTKWHTMLKVLVTLPIILLPLFIGTMAAVILSVINPKDLLDKAKQAQNAAYQVCITQCKSPDYPGDQQSCSDLCVQRYPSSATNSAQPQGK